MSVDEILAVEADKSITSYISSTEIGLDDLIRLRIALKNLLANEFIDDERRLEA